MTDTRITPLARPRRRSGRGYKAGAWLVSLAVHAGLIGIASLWAWGAIQQVDDDELPLAVTLVKSAPVVAPPEPSEPVHELRVDAQDEPQPELVATQLPEVAPLDDDPRPRTPIADASPEIEAALDANWTPRPGSRANTGMGVGAAGYAGANGPRSGSGFGNGELEGTGSGSVPNDKPTPAVAGAPAPRAAAFVAAELLQNPRPIYPRASQRLNEQGSVLLRLHIGADGRVGEVELVESSGSSRLDQAALTGVKAWTFRPATRDGVAVESTELHRVTFQLAERPH